MALGRVGASRRKRGGGLVNRALVLGTTGPILHRGSGSPLEPLYERQARLQTTSGNR